ncbi:MAG: S8 family serine peptidase, partial [Mycobacteriales bacterium]
MTRISRRTARTASALTLGALLVALAAPSVSVAATPAPTGLDPALVGVGAAEQVVVTGTSAAAARAALLAVGADHLRSLPIIDGWSARVRAGSLATLASSHGVVAVTKDRAVTFTGGAWDASVTASPYAWNTQATDLWAGGRKGAGVTVAVLDTGVSQVPDLAGRLMAGPDLSGEGDNTTDSFGHGTVMAGIIGGSGVSAGAQPKTGVAPGATVLSVKLAGRNGASDVSTVLAGLSWVGAFKDTYGIKVLNLSWGVPSTQDPSIDPVNFAVERLWSLGVTVVVAAGNAGPNAATILKPGDDPLVITVGAYDEHGNSALGDDSIPAWSSQGPTAQGRAKPDLVAPGRT